jgi:hypothetical protein
MPTPSPTLQGIRLRPRQPLLIYLDLNKWIDLAHAETGTERGKEFEPALKAAVDLVSEGRAIFPLSSSHLFEVAKIGDDTRRRVLARLMVRLSQGQFLLSARSLITAELRSAIAIRFRKPIPSSIGHVLTSRVMSSLIDDEQATTLENFDDSMLQSPEVLEEFLATARINKDFINGWKTFADDHESGRAMRWDASRDERKRAYCVLVTMGIRERLATILAEFDLPLNILEGLGAKGCVELFEGVPVLDVEINLHVERNEHRDRKIAPNDEIDLGFLSLAVPYCHAVITEKFWTSLIRRLKLDQKYETFVGYDLKDISQRWAETLLGSARPNPS